MSNPRPDLVSGGEVLLQISGRSADTPRLRVQLNSHDISSDFVHRSDGSLLGVVHGLRDGRNLIVAAAGGAGHQTSASLVVVNHPSTGPIFSGPQQHPFYCQTTSFGLPAAMQPTCSVATEVSYQYMSTSGTYKPWPTSSKPAQPYPVDLAKTTVNKRAVPFIVRLEQGTIDRGVYQMAALFDGRTPTPTMSDSSWNGRLVYTFGGGFNSGYHQGMSTGGVVNAASGPGGIDLFLSQGYAVASNSLNVLATNASIPISAEAAMMTKEHFVDEYGTPAYTIGWGGSGGSVQQYSIADAYPGIVNGIIPSLSLSNAQGTTEDYVSDCRLLNNYFANNPALSLSQKTAISGFRSYETCATLDNNPFTVFVGSLKPTASCDASIPQTVAADPATRWNATTNPRGVKCSVPEQIVNQLGVNPNTGFANSYVDNIGIQYGLTALKNGQITAAEFANLNSNIGGWNYLGDPTAARSAASPVALKEMYADDLGDCACQGLTTTPIIDQRDYEDTVTGTYAIHPSVESFVTRARLQAAGVGSNQVIIEQNPVTDTAQLRNANAYELASMDAWLSNIQRDESRRSTQQKIAADKPSALADGCFLSDTQTRPTLQPGGLTATGRTGPCESAYPVYANPRITAGQPESLESLACRLEPIQWDSYPVKLTKGEKAELHRAFPEGVCDYSDAGRQQQLPVGTWLNYSKGTIPFRS